MLFIVIVNTDLTAIDVIDAIKVSKLVNNIIMGPTYLPIAYSGFHDGMYVSGPPTMTSDAVFSPCPAGQYCANDRLPQDCGNTSHYSASGASVCLHVSDGYFTTPTSGAMTQRTGQAVCPIGFMCAFGVAVQCPPGTYQNESGQSTCNVCSVRCPGNLIVSSQCSSAQDMLCSGMEAVLRYHYGSYE